MAKILSKSWQQKKRKSQLIFNNIIIKYTCIQKGQKGKYYGKMSKPKQFIDCETTSCPSVLDGAWIVAWICELSDVHDLVCMVICIGISFIINLVEGS